MRGRDRMRRREKENNWGNIVILTRTYRSEQKKRQRLREEESVTEKEIRHR
jgi:hypothetical protein